MASYYDVKTVCDLEISFFFFCLVATRSVLKSRLKTDAIWRVIHKSHVRRRVRISQHKPV